MPHHTAGRYRPVEMASAASAGVRGQPLQAPYSAGTQPPQVALPWGAADCHHHVFDPRYPERQGLHPLPQAYRTTPPDVAAYRLFQRRLGLTRSVIVAPSNYGNDNSLLVDALGEIGQEHARGVAIVAFDAGRAELDRLHQAGVRGVRVYLAKGRAPSEEQLISLGRQLEPRGWHLQLVGSRDEEVFAKWEAALAEVPCRVVIDHFGYVPQPGGTESATAAVLRRLLDAGKTYVKLSGVYIQSRTGYPSYADMDELAMTLIRQAPERLVWGSDWPHVGALAQKPDGAGLVDQLTRWTASEAVRRLILVENPDRLYWDA